MSKVPEFDWYLSEWLDAYGMKPAELQRRCGWSKRKISELMTGQMRYNKHVLNEAAFALNIFPYELLMHPADASRIRALIAATNPNRLALVADARQEFRPELPEDPLHFKGNGTDG